MSAARATALAVVTALALAACGGAPAPAARGADPVAGSVSVFAAASLLDAFTALGTGFRHQHAAANVQFDFEGTPSLLLKLQQGAPADVFAAADQPNIQKAAAGGLLAGPARDFVSNRLEIVVAAGNPKHVRTLTDLARPDLIYITAGPTVPAGNYAGQVLARAGVRTTPRSLETDVKRVVSKVSLGEADAGIVYVTDVSSGGKSVQGVQIPDDQNVVARYPIALVKEAPNGVAGQAFIDYALSGAGEATLKRFGFGPP